MDSVEIFNKYFNDNKYVYGIAIIDIIAGYQYLHEFLKSKNIEGEYFLTFGNNYHNYWEKFSKNKLLNGINEKSIIILTGVDYQKYYNYLKDTKKYIFIIDHSLELLNTIENIIIINFYKYKNETKNFIDFTINSPNLYKYLINNNYTEHLNIISDSLLSKNINFNYIKSNIEFLSYFVMEILLSSVENNNNNSNMQFQLIYKNISVGKTLILLSEYSRCLYSFFPDKKILLCNYIYNMLKYINYNN